MGAQNPEGGASDDRPIEVSTVGEGGRGTARNLAKISAGEARPEDFGPGYYRAEDSGIGLVVDKETADMIFGGGAGRF